MSRQEWDERWNRAYVYLREQSKSDAFERAHDFMRRTHGPRPDGPPSVEWIAFKLWWLYKVKKMDLKKLAFGALAAFGMGFLAVLPALMDQGITGAEWMSAVAAGLAALGLYLKDPNSSKGPDLR